MWGRKREILPPTARKQPPMETDGVLHMDTHTNIVPSARVKELAGSGGGLCTYFCVW